MSRLRARFRWLDWLLTVNERASAIGGGILSSAIALAAFLSLFPLLVVGIAIVGYFSAGDVDFAQRTVENFGLEGDAADTVLEAIHSAERNREATTIIGLAGLTWSGLAVMGAVEHAVNAAWQVKGRGLWSKPRAMIWLVGVGILFLASTGLTQFATTLPGPAVVGSLLLSLVIDTLVVLSMFRIMTNVHVGWRAHLPGAIVGGTGLALLKLISGIYVPRLVESSSLYGSIGVVFAMLAWLLLMARLLVYAAVVNVIAYERGHGTVTVEIELPRIDGEVPLHATRGGAVDSTVSADD